MLYMICAQEYGYALTMTRMWRSVLLTESSCQPSLAVLKNEVKPNCPMIQQLHSKVYTPNEMRDSVRDMSQTTKWRGWRDDPVVKGTSCSFSGPAIEFQHSHGGLQGDLKTSGSRALCACGTQTHMQGLAQQMKVHGIQI